MMEVKIKQHRYVKKKFFADPLIKYIIVKQFGMQNSSLDIVRTFVNKATQCKTGKVLEKSVQLK